MPAGKPRLFRRCTDRPGRERRCRYNRQRTLIARRRIEAHPFGPADKEERNRHCQEVLTIQAHGLSRRLRHINCQTTVIGISGGLDSTLALLATCEAYRLNDWSLKGIIGITMPGFGTTDRTLANALQLMEELGITIRQIPISAASDSIFGHRA